MKSPFFKKQQLKKPLIVMLSLMSITSHADSHATGELDPTAPIIALANLDSLKNESKLHVNLPNIQHFNTDNGVPVALVQTPNLPIVDIALYFKAGSAYDEQIKQGGFGIASLTASMLKKGTSEQSENQVAEKSEQLGVNLSSHAYKDMFIVSLRSLSDNNHLTPAVDLMKEIISEPTFPHESLQRTKAQYLSAIRENQENPSAIASLRFDQELYGNHPYAHPTIGTEQSIANIERDDLAQFAKQFLVNKNLNIAITGNISLEKAKKISNLLTKSLPQGNKSPTLPNVTPLSQSKTVHIPFDSSQTSISMGQVGLKRGTDNKTLQQQTNFALADEIIGGSNFQARLMREIRKNRGLTYGIYSSATPMQAQGSYEISLSTSNDKADEAVKQTLIILKEAIDNGVTQDELTLTKDSLKNSFPLSFSSNSSINSTLGMMGFYGLPDSYLSEYHQRIDNATLNDVNKSYRELVKPDNFLIVTVGNQKTQQKSTNQPSSK
ncbi:M16 family metallopeptidase [Faucicola boevrei]|uniref:M16 family metallopeptidase n=1 Tax=Faucicola boevrei TaxID=346665 RepID=UPI000366CACA|nr:pitrilysin family protein [Moraxella boevrei]